MEVEERGRKRGEREGEGRREKKKRFKRMSMTKEASSVRGKRGREKGIFRMREEKKDYLNCIERVSRQIGAEISRVNRNNT